MHPRRHVFALLYKQFPILIIQRASQFADHLAIDAVVVNITQHLENCSFYMAGANKRLERGIAESDLPSANFRNTGRVIGWYSTENCQHIEFYR